MSKGSMKDFIKHAEIWTTKHSPEILTGLGITGMFGYGSKSYAKSNAVN